MNVMQLHVYMHFICPYLEASSQSLTPINPVYPPSSLHNLKSWLLHTHTHTHTHTDRSIKSSGSINVHTDSHPSHSHCRGVTADDRYGSLHSLPQVQDQVHRDSQL